MRAYSGSTGTWTRYPEHHPAGVEVLRAALGEFLERTVGPASHGGADHDDVP